MALPTGAGKPFREHFYAKRSRFDKNGFDISVVTLLSHRADEIVRRTGIARVSFGYSADLSNYHTPFATVHHCQLIVPIVRRATLKLDELRTKFGL